MARMDRRAGSHIGLFTNGAGRVSRRAFLGSTAAGGAGLLLAQGIPSLLAPPSASAADLTGGDASRWRLRSGRAAGP